MAPPKNAQPPMLKKVERAIERGLYVSRWLMAPFYIGLSLSLLLLLSSFIQELFHFLQQIPNITQADAVLAALSLIDLSLAGNLVLIVIFSGYENFVSKIDTSDDEDQFDWRGNVDFSALKLKLIASIVAISGIHLLKVFMDIAKYRESDIQWMITLHVVFVFSGVFLALMDWLASKAKKK
ncbi:MAG TPA: TIGR00645 family protein [Patescibacteria group bacterium]|nr:TIGR00645 family protein [Patescibacteria group bacterium]